MLKHLRSGGVVVCCAMVISLVIAVGCGSDTPTSPPAPTAVGGNVNKAPIAGATINIHAIDPDGSIGALVAGPFTTDADGNWVGLVPPLNTGPFVLVVTGGSYVDESTGSTVTLAAGQEMYGILQGASAHVTPMTHATFEAMQALVDGGTPLSTAVGQATFSSEAAFGFNFATTVPSDDPSATIEQKQYAALLGGLSTLLDGNPALSAFTSTPPMDLVTALARDMADGKLDGLDAWGNAILVPLDATGTTTAPLPALSSGDLSAWLDAATAYAATVPSLNGITFNSSTVWNPSKPPSGGGGGSVVFSGSGASQLPTNTFVPTYSSVFDPQLIWDDDVNNIQVLVVPGSGTIIQTIYVSYTIGETSLIWNMFNLAGIPGATRSGGNVTFVNVSLDQLTGGTSTLILNGDLPEPTVK